MIWVKKYSYIKKGNERLEEIYPLKQAKNGKKGNFFNL